MENTWITTNITGWLFCKLGMFLLVLPIGTLFPGSSLGMCRHRVGIKTIDSCSELVQKHAYWLVYLNVPTELNNPAYTRR